MSFPFLEPFLRKYFIYHSKRYGIWYCKGLLSFINVFSGDIVTLHWVNQNLQLREQNIYSLYFWKLYLRSLCYPLLIPDEGQPKLSTSLYYQVRGPFFPGSSSLPSYIPVLGYLPGFGLYSGFSMLDTECAWGSLARDRFAGLSSSLPVNTQIIIAGVVAVFVCWVVYLVTFMNKSPSQKTLLLAHYRNWYVCVIITLRDSKALNPIQF